MGGAHDLALTWVSLWQMGMEGSPGGETENRVGGIEKVLKG